MTWQIVLTFPCQKNVCTCQQAHHRVKRKHPSLLWRAPSDSLVPAGTAVLTHGRDCTMQAESKHLELGTSPLESDNGKNVLASQEPLSQLRQHGNKVILLEPRARTKSVLPSPTAATTSPKRRRLPHSRQKTVKSTAAMRPYEPSGATRTNKMRTAHSSIHQVNNATEHDNGTGTMLKHGSFNSSKPRRLRRRKKRLKLNLFQPRRRKLTGVQKRSQVRKCLPVEVWQHTGRCEPEQRKLEDHMTESSVVRPRVYGVDPIIGNEEREQLTRQHAVKRAHHVHLQPPEELASQESQEDYYNYSPEYHDEEDYHQHHSYESPEDVNDEDFQEADHRERHLASPNISPEKGSLPKMDENSTRAKSAAMDTKDDGKLMEGTKHLNYSDISKDTVDLANQNASSRMLNDTVEGFTLLIEDDRELASIRLHQDPPNSTRFEEGLNHDPEEIKLSTTDPTPAAPSELAAMSGIQQVTRDADNIREGVHGASSNRRAEKGYSKFFSFAEVPAHGQHRFGYRKGNDQHFTGRLELADGPHVKSVVVWADRKGGHGKHIWDYNHED
ncbi:uncharacterized protein LOC119396712 [Rhipicephalus sanguineus]|uniref:uncharacterized protein LOC119396712 n=1 Tax=Rhipicephalus sanguineus TaxID=34632 RepID=UPI001893A470|nr:uncharacterized protein LOC119396712 [Rhipicephalus sanguineus]